MQHPERQIYPLEPILGRYPTPQYLIEREIPGAGSMTSDQLRAASKHSNTVIAGMGPDIEWVHSYVAGDKIYCVYNSPNEDLIRAHQRGHRP